jgi:hypothetical protein
MLSAPHPSSTHDQDLLYSSATPSHIRRPSWPLSFGFDSLSSTGGVQCASMSSIPFPSGQNASVRRSQRRSRDGGDVPQPWMFTPDYQVRFSYPVVPPRLILNQRSVVHSQVHGDDSEEVLYVASPPTPQFPPTIPVNPSLNGRKHPTPSGYPFADDSSNCIYTASPKSHPSCLPTRNASFPPPSISVSSPFQPPSTYQTGPSPWNGTGGDPAAIYSTSNSTGCLFSSSGSSGALLSLNQANLMLLQKTNPSLLTGSSGGGSRSRKSSHGRTSSLESISEEEEE